MQRLAVYHWLMFRADIEATIDEAMDSADPEVQTNFKSILEINALHQKNIFTRQ